MCLEYKINDTHIDICSIVQDHDKRINMLEVLNSKTEEKVINLCDGLEKSQRSIASLNKALWGLTTAILICLLSYILSTI